MRWRGRGALQSSEDCSVVQKIVAAKDEDLVGDKAYHELRMALAQRVRKAKFFTVKYANL